MNVQQDVEFCCRQQEVSVTALAGVSAVTELRQ